MSEREKLEQRLLKEKDAYFHMCIHSYLDATTKADFSAKEENFWAEFNDPEILSLIEDIYYKESFRTFRSTMLSISSSVVVQLVMNPKTSYKMLSEICPYIDLALLKGFLQCHSLDDCTNEKIRFTFLFKVLEPIFLYPVSDRTTSRVKIMQAKKWFLQYTTCSSDSKPNIMDCLCGEIPADGIDDEWMIEEIRRCL